MDVEGNKYYITKRKKFRGICVDDQSVNNSFHFAYEMTFEGKREHRDHRSGGIKKRSPEVIFVNAFQGKLAEFALYNYLCENNIQVQKPDIDTYGKGEWDNYDFKINDKTIAVKSTKWFGNLLLLETKDWNEKGEYKPNLNKSEGSVSYDYIVLIRIKPIIKEDDLKKYINLDKNKLIKRFNEICFCYDIPGYADHYDFLKIIKHEHIIPQHAKLNGKIPMDAENYYFQAGELKDISYLVNDLKN